MICDNHHRISFDDCICGHTWPCPFEPTIAEHNTIIIPGDCISIPDENRIGYMRTKWLTPGQYKAGQVIPELMPGDDPYKDHPWMNCGPDWRTLVKEVLDD